MDRKVELDQQSIYFENVKNVSFNYSGKKIKKILGSLPIYPEIFIGRDNDLEKIHAKLFEGQRFLLLVNGEGGIGKTTVASKYYHRYIEEYNHLIWLLADIGMTNALIALAAELQLMFADNLSVDERINEILKALIVLDRPCLLIMDNANNLEDLEKSYPLLRKCSKLHILLTSRITEFANAEKFPIRHLNNTDARTLFTDYYKNHDAAENDLLDKILEAVGYNTLVIEILAKNMNNFNSILHKEYSLQNVLEDLQKRGILKLSKSKNVSVDHKFASAKPEEIVEAMYDISGLSEEEKGLLSVLSVLPAINIPFSHLQNLMPDFADLHRIALLVAQKGWVEFNQDSKSFKISPVVQEVVRNQNREKLIKHCTPLVSSLNKNLEYEPGTGKTINHPYEKAVIYIQYGEMVCRYLNQLVDNTSLLFERIGNFYANYGYLDKALKYFEERSRLCKERYKSNPQNLGFKQSFAISYLKLGDTHTSLGNLNSVLKYYEERSRLSKELYESDPQNLEFKHCLAISYERLGSMHTTLGNLNSALKYYEESSRLSKELYESNPEIVRFKQSFAISFEKLGSTHTSLGNLEDALMFFKDCMDLTKELYESNPKNIDYKNDLAVDYSKLGDIHFSLSNLGTALKFFEDFMQLITELYEFNQKNINYKNGLAVAYSKLGDTHTCLGNLENALKYYEDSLSLSKELYESNPKNVDFKHSLALSYAYLGTFYRDRIKDINIALSYFLEAKSLWEQLVSDFPEYIVFQNSLGLVNKDLEPFQKENSFG